MKHTEGNWEVRLDKEHKRYDIVSDDLLIATIWEEHAFRNIETPTQAEANARLIAKAPEMLGLLELYNNNINDSDQLGFDMVDEVYDLLTSIKGKQ